jgi:hypothetical protein
MDQRIGNSERMDPDPGVQLMTDPLNPEHWKLVLYYAMSSGWMVRVLHGATVFSPRPPRRSMAW